MVLRHISPLVTIHLRRHGVLLTILHTQNGLHDRTNKGASFVIEPLSIAYILQPTSARHKIDLSR